MVITNFQFTQSKFLSHDTTEANINNINANEENINFSKIYHLSTGR